eukprot:TRINITY_DN63416_c0_g1_i1.p1 TRINITY_DN63416_c0_g1~~TRINITY_DN63416_c0_g1_i1.p1  ORF type:complete len:266 (-),score=53.46 TRINITY_DN63416_c0_g1_i1:172-969(-)
MGLSDRLIANPHSVSDILRCPVCHEVFIDPVASECQHVFCRQCLQEWLEHDSSCPTCREPIQRFRDHRVLRSFVDELIVICSGCGWRGRQDSLQQHLMLCLNMSHNDALEQLQQKTEEIESLKEEIEVRRQVAVDQHRELENLRSQLQQEFLAKVDAAQKLADLQAQAANQAIEKTILAREAARALCAEVSVPIGPATAPDTSGSVLITKFMARGLPHVFDNAFMNAAALTCYSPSTRFRRQRNSLLVAQQLQVISEEEEEFDPL